MRIARALLPAVALAGSLALGAPGSARAFERSTVDDDPSTALFWRHRTILLRPLYDSSDDLADEQVAGALARSIATWNAAATGCSDLFLVDDGWASGTSTNLDRGDHDGENRIRWREASWPEEAGPETLALTTVVYRRASGQILDADIDLNGLDHIWSVSPTATPGQVDAENTLTHEIGHLIGLSHVSDPAATMYDQSPPGDLEKRSLSDDEVSAVCTIYPERGLSPGAPMYRPEPLTSSCAARPGRSGGAVAWLLVALVLSRRRRGSSAAPRGGGRRGRACGASAAPGRAAGPSRGPRGARPTG